MSRHVSTVTLLAVVALLSQAGCDRSDGLAFVPEPPSLVAYRAEQGTSVSCHVRGVPSSIVTWVDSAGLPLQDLPGVRVVHGNGTLQLMPMRVKGSPRGAGRGAGGAQYRCRATSRRGTALSRTVTLLPVHDASWQVRVRGFGARRGAVVELSCDAGGALPDAVRDALLAPQWYRDEIELRLSFDGRFVVAGRMLLLRDAAPRDAGAYSCSVRLSPRVAPRRSPPLRLVITDHSTSTRYHVTPHTLVPAIQKRVKRKKRHARADSLGAPESPPELHYTFIEQVLRPGGDVSLRCVAAGAPPPRITWLRDALPLLSHRYFISEEITVTGEVVSALNISAAMAADGGRYTCRAHNAHGHVAHSARLNIYGPVTVRAVPPVRLVAGTNASVFCPYAGFPISSVTWSRGAAVLPGEGRVAARGGELRLAPALAPDAGHYTCSVIAPSARPSRADVEIQVRNPPKISPFMFSSELTEGSSAQVLCGVSSGDKPMYFSWFKDGAPLPPNLQVEEKSLNEFSLLMFSDLTARHSGDYTCRVTNHAAAVDYTATLTVKVAPSWVSEPQDAALLLGAPLHLQCLAAGHPPPTVLWYRRIGAGGDGGGQQWETVAGEGSRGGELRAGGVARVHAGEYRCVADNGVGVPLVKHINITVHEPAQLVETQPAQRNVSVRVGEGVRLQCAARGDAPLALAWTRRGDALPKDDYRWSVSESRSAQVLHSTLSLRAAERSDAGEYRCVASNRFGRTDRLLLLQVEEPPPAPVELRLNGRGVRWAGVSWRAPPGDQYLYQALLTTLQLPASPGQSAEPLQPVVLNLTLDSTLDERVAADGLRAQRARLSGLRAATRYSVRLRVATHAGVSVPSHPLLLTTLDDAPTGAPRDVRVTTSGAAGELHVTWSAPPREDWNGELLGYAVSWRELRDDDAGGEETRRGAGQMTARGGSAGEATLGGLRPATRHNVAVRAFNRAGPGPASSYIHSTAPTGVPQSAPRGVRCEGVSSSELRVSWEPDSALAPALRGYDLHYVPIDLDLSWSETPLPPAGGVMQTAGGRFAVVGGLRAGTNYSMSVRARTAAGAGRACAPVYCVTGEDVGGVVTSVRARSAGADAVLVVWLPPERARRGGLITHYTLYIRELGKVSGEWSQRVPAPADDAEGEVPHVVGGLSARAGYEFRVRAHTARGPGPTSRAVSAAPAPIVAPRVWSFGRELAVAEGTQLRLRCGAEGAPLLRRRWVPLSPHHSLTDAGDLILHKLEARWAGNYTCTARNAAGEDLVTHRVRLRVAPPPPPPPRLLRATEHALTLAWDPLPPSAGDLLIGYTVQWEREEAAGDGGEAWVPAGDVTLHVTRLACGALYRVSLRAHTARSASSSSPALRASTRGEKAEAPPASDFVWSNSTALRLNLLAWGGAGRCPVTVWRLALREPAATWHLLPVASDVAQANELRPGTWYEIRVVAQSPAGETSAVYRAATLTHNGEVVGAAALQSSRDTVVSAVEGGVIHGDTWRGVVSLALMGAALGALIAALTALVLLRRRGAQRLPLQDAMPPTQIYSTAPGGRNGKTLSPPDDGDISEISPYATFSMSEGGAGGGGCALQLHTFGRAEPRGLAAPPPPRSLNGGSCGRSGARESDSDSSGSSCVACRRAPLPAHAAHPADLLPAQWAAVREPGGLGPRGGGGRRRRGNAPGDRSRVRRSDAL